MKPYIALGILALWGCKESVAPTGSVSESRRLETVEAKPGCLRIEPAERDLAPRVFEFQFSNFSPGDPDAVPAPVPPQVYVEITKFDADAGKVEWNKIHKEGQSLGLTLEDGKPTHTHLVFSAKKGRMVPVDFNSGGKVYRIEVDRMVEYEYKACNPDVVGGALVCPGPEAKKGHFRVNRVFYSDEEGKPMKAESSAGPGRRPDSLCLNHGGDGKAVPPAPVVNGDREEEASNLLDHAEELWLSSSQADRRKAVEAYKKLLSSFGDTEAVKKHKDRISGRSKKKLD